MISPEREGPPVTHGPTVAGEHKGTRLLVKMGRIALTAGLPVVIALVVGGIVLTITGYNPFSVYGDLAKEAFGSWSRINATLAAATPLLFTGIAAAFSFRAGVFSVGVEGSFVLGGLTAAVIGAHMGSMPIGLAILIPLLGASIAGFLVAAIPAVLRSLWAVDEVVTTLMFNFIVVGLAGWSVLTFFQERGQANSATAYISENASLPPLAPPGQANWALIVALAILAAYSLWMRYSTLGFEFRAVGNAPRFAIAQGLRVRLVLLVALLGAGVIGGIGGGSHALGIVGRYSAGFSASFGFTGIAIALLARFNPVGILIGAILFGALNSAGSTVQLFINLPVQLIDILEGTVMVLAVAVFAAPRWWKRRASRRASRPSGGVS